MVIVCVVENGARTGMAMLPREAVVLRADSFSWSIDGTPSSSL